MNSNSENGKWIEKKLALGGEKGLCDMTHCPSLFAAHCTTEQGLSLIETMVAVLIALIAVFSLGRVIFIASVTGKNQGTEATRATIYAQDKMEKLLSLGAPTQSPVNPLDSDFTSCTQSASLQPSQCNTTGISASSWTQGLLAGGSLSATTPDCSSVTAGYADFLDTNGMQLTASGCSAITTYAYVRQWQITDLTPPLNGPPMKQITVAVFAVNAENSLGGKPIVVLTSVLSNPN